MKKPELFQLAYYRSIPAYFNEDTCEIIGRNWFYDKLIALNIWWDFEILQIEELPILLEK